MGGAVFDRDRPFGPVAKPDETRERPLPLGYGLLISAGLSLSLWALAGLVAASLLT